VIPKATDLNAGFSVHGGPVQIQNLQTYQLKSIWETSR
jgi:hypothetical protein